MFFIFAACPPPHAYRTHTHVNKLNPRATGLFWCVRTRHSRIRCMFRTCLQQQPQQQWTPVLIALL